MARLPKVYYSLALLILIIALSGCELRRNPDEISDPAPVSDVPPTLAPLGAVESLGAEATAVPTIISVQPTATISNLEEGQAAPNPAEPDAPTAEAVDLSEPEAIEGVAAADIAPVAEDVASAPEAESSQEAIVVDATTTEEPAIVGPVAANPPFSQTDGSYDTSTYSSSGTYIVQPGDTLFGVAQRFGTTVQALASANGLANDLIYAGQVLNLSGGDGGNYANQPYNQPAYQPPADVTDSGIYHMVASGETLYSIALQYNSSVDAIASANQIDYPFTISVGQQLAIPASGFGGPPQVDNFGPPPGNAPAPDNFYQTVPGNASLHLVAPGETLYSIALQYGTSVDAIAGANRVPYPYTIGVGQQLLIPAPGAYAGPPPPMPADGYFQQPYQGYQPQGPADGFNQQPYQGYQPPAPADNYGAAPGNYPAPGDNYANTPGTHTVAPGETLYSIARIHGLNAEALAAANGLSNPNQLFVGQVLYLP